MFLTIKSSIPLESEIAVQVASEHAPTETTAAIAKYLILTFDGIELSAVPEAF